VDAILASYAEFCKKYVYSHELTQLKKRMTQHKSLIRGLGVYGFKARLGSTRAIT
jgi:hypothetical protein